MKKFLLPFEDSIKERFDQSENLINPPFPNWQKSFVSGSASPLFKVDHRIDSAIENLLLTQVEFKPSAEGPPAHVHGGASAALIDETMGVIAWHSKHPSVTENLNLNFVKALPLNQTAYLATWISQIDQKNIQVQCAILSAKNVIFVSGVGLFHQLSKEQLERFKNLMNP